MKEGDRAALGVSGSFAVRDSFPASETETPEKQTQQLALPRWNEIEIHVPKENTGREMPRIPTRMELPLSGNGLTLTSRLLSSSPNRLGAFRPHRTSQGRWGSRPSPTPPPAAQTLGHSRLFTAAVQFPPQKPPLFSSFHKKLILSPRDLPL